MIILEEIRKIQFSFCRNRMRFNIGGGHIICWAVELLKAYESLKQILNSSVANFIDMQLDKMNPSSCLLITNWKILQWKNNKQNQSQSAKTNTNGRKIELKMHGTIWIREIWITNFNNGKTNASYKLQLHSYGKQRLYIRWHIWHSTAVLIPKD